MTAGDGSRIRWLLGQLRRLLGWPRRLLGWLRRLLGRLRRAPGWLRTRAENVGRIARWEVTKNAGGLDKKTVVIALVALVGLGALAPVVLSQGIALDDGIYRVGVSEDSPYYDAVAADDTFRIQEPDRRALLAGNQEILIRGDRVARFADTTKGRAAVSELRSTVERYNDNVMRGEANQSAAFPVLVNLTYVSRNVTSVDPPPQFAVSGPDDGTTGDTATPGGGTAGDGTGTGSDGSGTDGSGTDGAGTDTSGDGSGTDGDGAGTAGDGDGSGTAGDGDGSGTPGDGTDGTDTNDGSGGGNVGGSNIADRLTGGSASGAPSDISPPFPFRSLVLAFIFVLPLNFIIQAYGSTILGERINRRGELLLVAPVSRGDIIAGKTLPYLAGALGVATLITLALQGSAVSVLAVVPLALLFLSATFLGAMFARSFKELTFVTVTITVSLTSYAFVPAIFTEVTPIALISPLTLVVRDLQGQAISLGQFTFSTLPPTLTAFVMFGLGAGLYREEDMFTQRPIPLKVLDALAGPISRVRHVGMMTAVLLPFVLVAELVVVALLFALGEISIILVLAAVAIVEEVAKSLHIYASYVHSRFDRGLRRALTLGAASGVGFFVAEKFQLIAQLGDLQSRDIGQAQQNDLGVLGADVPLALVAVGLLVAPLVLHVVTASISAVGARRGRQAYLGAITVAIVVHFAYNLTVVSILVG